MAHTESTGQVLIEPDSEAPGQRRCTGKGHVDSYGQGRVCAAPRCATLLSRYNSGCVCWLHETVVVMSTRYWTR